MPSIVPIDLTMVRSIGTMEGILYLHTNCLLEFHQIYNID